MSARLDEALCEQALAGLASGGPVDLPLEPWGRLYLDRSLPFLCLYRRPWDRADPDTHTLVSGCAAYLLAPGEAEHDPALARLIAAIADEALARHGAFVLFELRTSAGCALPDAALHGAPGAGLDSAAAPTRPLRLFVTRPGPPAGVLRVLEEGCLALPGLEGAPAAEVIDRVHLDPPAGACALLGGVSEVRCAVELELRAPHHDAHTGARFPLRLRCVRRALARTFEQAAFAFARTRARRRPSRPEALGRRHLEPAAQEVDRALVEVSQSYDLLLSVTPTNVHDAWEAFCRDGCEREPELRYRPVATDPDPLLRRLYALPLDAVEDPALQGLFREQRDWLAEELRLLEDRGTPRFLLGSLRLHGGVDDRLYRLAQGLPAALPDEDPAEAPAELVPAETFAERARAEVAHYRQLLPGATADVQLRDDVASIMVSKGRLLIPRETLLPPGRVEALLQHEVGTHLVTWWNGGLQPLGLLRSGLAGYTELQEALAVLAEYLAGELSAARLRTLAARVIAVRLLADGGGFVDVFRELTRTHGLRLHAAFLVAARVFRGGGYTKDAVYLRGLVRLLERLRQGAPLEPLLAGKVAFHHLPLLDELVAREVVRPPALRPRYLSWPRARKRLEQLARGRTVLDLLEREVA